MDEKTRLTNNIIDSVKKYSESPLNKDWESPLGVVSTYMFQECCKSVNKLIQKRIDSKKKHVL